MEKAGSVVIGNRIKLLRKAKGETQAQLGEAIGVVQQSVAAWEGERCQPDLGSLISLAKHFNVSTDYILGVCEDAFENSLDKLSALQRDLDLAAKLPVSLREMICAVIRIEKTERLQAAS